MLYKGLLAHFKGGDEEEKKNDKVHAHGRHLYERKCLSLPLLFHVSYLLILPRAAGYFYAIPIVSPPPREILKLLSH